MIPPEHVQGTGVPARRKAGGAAPPMVQQKAIEEAKAMQEGD